MNNKPITAIILAIIVFLGLAFYLKSNMPTARPDTEEAARQGMIIEKFYNDFPPRPLSDEDKINQTNAMEDSYEQNRPKSLSDEEREKQMNVLEKFRIPKQ